MVLGNVLARALMKPFRGQGLARFLILLPWAAPISLATLAGSGSSTRRSAVINWVLKVAGWLGPGQWYYWLGDTTLGMVAIITIQVWAMLPFSTVILLAGLTSIPTRCARRPPSTARGCSPDLPHRDSDDAADPDRRRALRRRVHVHRYERRLSLDPRRSLQLHPRAGQPRLPGGRAGRDVGAARRWRSSWSPCW